MLAPGGAAPEVVGYEKGGVFRRPYTLPGIGPKLSRPVRELPRSVPAPAPRLDTNTEINPPRHETLFDEQGRRFGTSAPKIDDLLADTPPAGQLTPAPSITFEGVSNIQGFYPPDTEGAVGPNHYVHGVNVSFAVLDKAGTFLTGPTDTSAGGHFAGSTVLHWAAGAEGRGALFAGDTIQVGYDRRWVSFMYSYPNMVPLSESKVRRIVVTVEPFEFDRIYSPWLDRLVSADGKEIVRRSAERYIAAIRDDAPRRC